MAKIICILVRVNIYSRSGIGTGLAPARSSDPASAPRRAGESGSDMSRVYGEPVNVQARDDGRPARFVWRGRLYTVDAILEHWVINRVWWQDLEAEPGQPELEFWRVEASPGQGITATVYELRRDAATEAWTLRPTP
jgi:Family of unknown function (DUF6504)